MKIIIAVNVAMAAMAAAADCGDLVINDNSCSSGTLASSDDIESCKTQLCAAMDQYAKAHGSDASKVLKGSSYGCVYEADDDDVKTVICETTDPGPDPTPNPTSDPGPDPDKKKNKSSGGISGGAVFLIVFFVGGFVYFAAGTAYGYKVKGESGVAAIPQVEFWKDLPVLMKDGVLFLKNKVTGGYTSV